MPGRRRSFAARSIPASRPTRGLSRTSTRSTPSTMPRKPIFAAKLMRGGPCCGPNTMSGEAGRPGPKHERHRHHHHHHHHHHGTGGAGRRHRSGGEVMSGTERKEKYQLLPDLPPDEYTALKADIAANGVLVPVELDEFGIILDGHHRARACRGPGINDYPTVVRRGMSEEEKRAHARKLNVLRRHLNREQTRALVEDQLLETPGWSNNRIGQMLGVDGKTITAVRG